MKYIKNLGKNDHQLIDSFFTDQMEYFEFSTHQQELVKMNEPQTCKAELKKEGDLFLYTLTWLEDGMFIGEYIQPFKAGIDNIEKFNFGCKVVALRMAAYLQKRNIQDISDDFPAFGEFTKPVY